MLDEFCKLNFQNYIYINLERDEEVREIFNNSINPENIINNLSLVKGFQIDCDNTVIFIDEIQVSERAITSLKYFNESTVNYNIVCAGSMLGVALNRFKSSYPVGKVYRVLVPF
ncbi:MAG: AAA family ATPase [Clostridiales bacterium]|nr:AAA family ATPase [Clostridiales bacterium]